jgi:triosephosphate isomerase
VSRRPYIVGNWKMHKTPAEADALAGALKRGLAELSAADVGVAPPAISIPAVVARLKATGVRVAGQDLHAEASGAYTSAISGEMLRAAGCSDVIVGHSERRALFGDDDGLVNRKVHAAFRAGLIPILCVGESLPHREAGEAEHVVSGQLAAGLSGLSTDQIAALSLAYEPVWAIGTGRTATPEQAGAMHSFIRSWLVARYPSYVAQGVRILYGGSVKASNAAGLLCRDDVDGLLVGGASLDAEGFLAIVSAAETRRDTPLS